MSKNITFVILTFNEAARIERVIKNFIGYGNVLLADDNSTDGTLEIARSYGCEILIRTRKYDYIEDEHLINLVCETVKTEWVYWGFADEMLEKETLDQIASIITADKYDIINIDRKNYYYGKFCYNVHHARMNKIFKKKTIDFTDNKIHGFGNPLVHSKRICQLPDKYFVHHFISYTTYAYLNVINRYTELERPSRRKLSPILLFLYLFQRAFFVHFIKEKGYKAGFAAIALIELHMFYLLVKNMKFYEKQNDLTFTKIENVNNNFRINILETI